MSGILGFLINYNLRNIVVFVQNSRYDKEIIIGFKNSLPKNCEFFYLDKNLELKKHLVLKDYKFRYAKLSLSEKTIIDYENLTIWLSAKKYKLSRQIFEENTNEYDEKDLIKKIVNISEYFS